MNRIASKAIPEVLHKIENIEKDVLDLKLTLLKNLTPGGKKVVSLKGILKGLNIAEEDISSAKKALYDKLGA